MYSLHIVFLHIFMNLLCCFQPGDVFVLFVFNMSSKPLQKHVRGVESYFVRIVFFLVLYNVFVLVAPSSTGREVILNITGAFPFL